MSFKTNDCQQLSLDDSFITLTERERKALEKSWAKIFADEIFPAIDEERFSVLYSDKASRPNAPVNVIIGALIIKELFDYSDDEIVENLMLDLHLQYALHTTSFAEQPISDKTLTLTRQTGQIIVGTVSPSAVSEISYSDSPCSISSMVGRLLRNSLPNTFVNSYCAIPIGWDISSKAYSATTSSLSLQIKIPIV